MDTPRLFPVMSRTALTFLLLAMTSACATAGVGRAGLPPGEGEMVAERGPRVHIWTRDETQTGERIGTSFRLDDDAYVVVVNVGRDGYANVIFPESPDDDGFMRGGRTYRLPPFFPGFPHYTRSDYLRLHTASSAYDEVYDRYAGYVFIIASWRPMHFEISEALGLWDDYRLAAHEQRLDPYVVMHRFADQLVPGRSRDYTARFARYAAFNRGFAGRSAFASCGSTFSVYPRWAYLSLLSAGWVPVYGYGFYDLGGHGCGTGFGLTLIGFRPGGRSGITLPVRPTPPPSDTAGAPPRPTGRPPKPPAVASDSGERKPHPRPRGRTEVVVDDDPIIDVTRETRHRLRREERDLERARRGLASEWLDPPDAGRRQDGEWRRADRVRASERANRDRDNERAGGRANADDNARVRHERPRGESRGSEPRESSRPRPEPRSQPAARSEPQSQPAARSEPRSQPAARSEPRSERPAKPERQ